MLKTYKSIVLVGLFAATHLRASEIQLVPVKATGGHSINGSNINVVAGARVTLEVRIRDWDSDMNGVPLIRSFESRFSTNGFTSGGGGSLSLAATSCSGNNQAGNAQCSAALGSGSRCDYPVNVGGNCSPIFINVNHVDWIFREATGSVPAVSFSSDHPRFGATTLDGIGTGINDDGTPYYAATIVLDVPENAEGTFTLNLMGGADSYLIDETGNEVVPAPSVSHATITIVPCGGDSDCADGNACTVDECDFAGRVVQGTQGKGGRWDSESGHSNRGQLQIECSGFEAPDFDAHVVGQTNFLCGVDYWNTCTATPIAQSCVGDPFTDVNCCVNSPNPLNGWYVSATSQHCREPHIDVAHPSTGIQHLRFTRDALGGNPSGCTSLGTACRVNAFTPRLPAVPDGPATVEFDLASSEAFGARFVYFSVDNDNSTSGTYMYFYRNTYIYVYDFGLGNFQPAGTWDSSGSYRSVRIEKDPCEEGGTIKYFYGGALIYSTNISGGEPSSINRGVFQHDNGGGPGQFWDVDNYCVTRIDGCLNSSGCSNTLVSVPTGMCCDPTVGNVNEDVFGAGSLVSNDDADPCTLNTCSQSATVGQPSHPPAPSQTPCDDTDSCTFGDVCNGAGSCGGQDVGQTACDDDFDCELAAQFPFRCNQATGFCACNEPCCLGDGRCIVTASGGCEVNAGSLVAFCGGDQNGNGLDDGCEVPCCLPNGDCDGRTALSCAQVGGTQVSQCLSDANGDGVSDGCAGDCNHNGILDIDEPVNGDKDCDGDGVCNMQEIDNCGVSEISCRDCNADGIPDGCQEDCNANGENDECELMNNPGLDANQNGMLDDCEPDCNQNGISDIVEITNGSAEDCNDNHIPDECETLGACCYHPFGGLTCFQSSRLMCEVYFGGTWSACGDCTTVQDTTAIDEGGTIFYHRIGNPEGCPGEQTPRPRGGCAGGPYYDAWRSITGSGVMCEQFGTPSHAALPGGFFGPGSDPFTGTICYEGVSLGLEGLGDTDTVIVRQDDPFSSCELPSTDEIAVEVRISQLSLKSVDSILVTYNGGQSPEAWNVTVGLSATVAQPPGTVLAKKTHCNGGTYTNTLYVVPKLTFKRASDNATVVFDAGTEGQAPVELASSAVQSWVHETDEVLGVLGDPCSKFRPGVEELIQTTNCDCNGNQLRDSCDIQSQTSQDCNGNARPDECDIALGSLDCDSNGVPDECEPDCNGNGIADACDIESEVSADSNSNNIPDECERTVSAPTADLGMKARYVSFRPGGSADGSPTPKVQALRVQSPNYPGMTKWVGPLNAKRIARLQCTPHYAEFGFGMIHIADGDIIPGKTYVIQGIGQESSTANEVAYSGSVAILTTPVWGDVVGTNTAQGWLPPNGIANIIDVAALVDTFKEIAGSLSVPRADLHPRVPNGVVNIADVASTIDGFKDLPYPFGVPSSCP